MATLSFEGETHGEIVVKVRRWLASLEGEEDGHISTTEAIEQGAELTKDALRIIASAAPEPVAQNEVVKALTAMGYKATDATKEALVDGLDTVEEVTGGSVVKRARDVAEQAVYEMNATIASRSSRPRPAGRGGRSPAPRPGRASREECRVAEIEIGMGKAGRRAYGLDDIAIVPSRRTRDPEDVDLSWEIDAFTLRPADHGRGHGQRGQPGHAPSRSAARRRRRPRTSRACGPATTTPSRCSPRSPAARRRRPSARLQELYAEPDQARADPRPHQGDPRRRAWSRAASVTPAARCRAFADAARSPPSSTCS